jgi:hypothetical protein
MKHLSDCEFRACRILLAFARMGANFWPSRCAGRAFPKRPGALSIMTVESRFGLTARGTMPSGMSMHLATSFPLHHEPLLDANG